MRRFALLAAGLALLAGVAAGLSGGATQAQSRWVIRDLGTLLGGREVEGLAINKQGQMIANADSGTLMPSYRAFHWENGKWASLGTLGGKGAYAAAINDRRQVVGFSDTKAKDKDGDAVSHAFLWQKGKMRDLGTRNSAIWRFGRPPIAINDHGQVVGQHGTGAWPHAFLWQNGKLRNLAMLPGGHKDGALAINEPGQIVGWSGNGTRPHAVLWENGKVRDLGTLPGDSSSYAVMINDSGQIVGRSYNPYEQGHYFLWEKGKLTDLGSLGEVTAINAHGQIVGSGALHPPSLADHAFVWEKGEIRDLGTLPGGFQSYAGDINERGQIAGWDVGGPVNHALLWENGKVTDLGGLPHGSDSQAQTLNERGEIAGMDWMETKGASPPYWHAVLWTKRG